jgi:hypothetical protein
VKQKHILNVGFPKCGTSWLWQQLVDHPKVTKVEPKENTLFLDTLDIELYKKYYSEFDITANFQILQWAIDQDLIQKLGTCTTHASIIFRDPYDFVERWRDWLYLYPSAGVNKMSDSEFIDWCIQTNTVDYKKIVLRWQNNLVNAKFKILLYRDLKNNMDEFLSDYFKFCELEYVDLPNRHKHVNVHPNATKNTLVFNANQINLINQKIYEFEEILKQDLSSWLR